MCMGLDENSVRDLGCHVPICVQSHINGEYISEPPNVNELYVS